MEEAAGLWVVLTAAGQGTRLGADEPKALVEVDGESLLQLALQRVFDAEDVRGVVVTAPEGLEQRFTEQVSASQGSRVRVVAGGASRQASVKAGLDELQSWMASTGLQVGEIAEQVVLVHDAARALTPPSLMNRLALALSTEFDPPPAGAIPGLPVTDTIKEVVPIGDGSGGVERVTETPERSSLRAVQTPQAFRMGPLLAAHERYEALGGNEGVSATDDASLLEWEGKTVLLVPGDELAFKVTGPADLEKAQEILQNK